MSKNRAGQPWDKPGHDETIEIKEIVMPGLVPRLSGTVFAHRNDN
jgi:hypothetical protein